MRHFLKYITSTLYLILIISLGYFSQIESEKRIQEDLFVPVDQRKSITFIMGEDKTATSYYTNAREHFVKNEDEKTDLVVNSCRTLSCVIEYLNHSEERGMYPWSVINIVAHGNPKTGLNLKLFDEGPKATPKRLVQATLINSLPRLKQGTIDSISKVNIWSCGIGKNPLINLSMKQLFKTGGSGNASLYCSPHFVIFHKDGNHKIHRMKASYWPFYYKRGYRPSLSEIEFSLKKEYTEDEVNWGEGLRNDEISSSGIFHQTYHLPISYTRVYKKKEDRPDISTIEKKRAWIFEQAPLVDQIEESDIPFDKFNWQVHKIIYTTEKGKKVPAIKAIGMASVLNILRIDEASE